MISNFSLRQRLHLLLELLYGQCNARMCQEIKCSMLLSLRVQICLLSSVGFLKDNNIKQSNPLHKIFNRNTLKLSYVQLHG